MSHGDREMFDSLTPVERDLVLRWLAESVLTGRLDNTVHDVLWEVDFKRKPVSIEQFIEDEYYFGKQGRDLHPLWKRDLSVVFAPNSNIVEWCLTGSIGSGKTTVACFAIGYVLYRLSCMRDPASYYGLLSGSQIIFGIYSITKRQVVDTGYSKLKGYIDGSPYFLEVFPRNYKIDSQVDFAKTTDLNLKVISGSTELHALGLDLYGYSLDEANFFKGKRDSETGSMIGQAYDLYNATRTRLMSRFMRPGGIIPGIMLLMSSRKAQTSFLEEHLKKNKDNPAMYVSDYALWDVKDPAKFGTKTFRVEVGDKTSQSRVLQPADKPRPGARIVEVPEGLKAPFLEDVDQALRDIAGVATFNISPFIRDRHSVLDAQQSDIPNPFIVDRIQIGTEDDEYIEDFFDIQRVCNVVNGKYRPILNPRTPRFLHVDLALTGDRAGIAMGHVAGLVRGQQMREDGILSEDKRPYTIIDFVIGLDPPLSGEIEIAKVRAFIMYLMKFYNLVRVTTDGFQSRDMVQILNRWIKTAREKVDRKQMDFASILSIDKTDAPYMAFRNALFERRVIHYPYSLLEREVLDLERNPQTGKVDHPDRASDGTRGSKDVADAVAGVVYTALNDARASIGARLLPEGVRPHGVGIVDPTKPVHELPSYRIIGGRKVPINELDGNAE